MKELSKLLENVVNEFGKNELYDIPTISWSEEDMVCRFAEYQYWKNHIIVSRFLNTDKVSDRAVESIIYHEYMHQIYREHTQEFQEKMKTFDGYDDYYEELNKYFNEIDCWSKVYKHNLQLEYDKQTVFCRLPFNVENASLYRDGMLNYNHMIIGVLPTDIPERYCQKPIAQVIWTIYHRGQEYIVGWAKNVRLYSKIEIVDLTRYELGIYKYQYKFLNKNGKWMCDYLKYFGAHKMENILTKDSVCDCGVLNEEEFVGTIDLINSYSKEFDNLGISDDTIYDIPAIDTKDIELLIDMAKAESYSGRNVWIMNKAVELEKSIRTYYWRGRAMECMGLLDEALKDYLKALEIDPNNEEIKYSINIMNEAIKAIPLS